MLAFSYLPLSTCTYSIVVRVYVLALDMYLIYKVPVISILVATNVMSETKGLKISQPGFAKAYKKWLSQQTPLKSTSVGEKSSQSAWGENLARVSKLVVAERAKVQGKRKSTADIVKEESIIASLRTDTVNKHIQKGSLLPPPPWRRGKEKRRRKRRKSPHPPSRLH